MEKFSTAVTKLIQKEDLSYDEMNYYFRRIMNNEETEMHQGAFLSALSAKGETPDEIQAVWQSIIELDTVYAKPNVCVPIVENSGTGMDKIKSFNISSLSAICAAADGVVIARHGARAITSLCGAVDILENVGVGVEVEADIVKNSIETCGIGIYNGMSPLIHPQALGRILSQISFGTVLNTAASLANPGMPDYAVRGVYHKDMVIPVANIMKKIGYKKAIVINGLDKDGNSALDEASILGETVYAFLNEDGTITSGSFMPEDMGLKTGELDDILAKGGSQENAERFIRILKGKGTQAETDIVCLNTALILFLTGKADTIKEGCQRTLEIINSQAAVNKLIEWVKTQNKEENKERALTRLMSLIEKV